MEVGKVIGTVIATVKHDVYEGKRLLVVQQVDLEGKPQGPVRLAIDYIGAGVGDLVLLGSAPGLAADVFKVKKAPIKDLIMGIVDHFDLGDQLVMTLYDEMKE